MKMKHNNLKTLLLLTTATFLALTGCIKEDMSKCPPKHNVELTFRYIYKDGGDSFGQEVENVEVFVFDAATGSYVTSVGRDKTDLAAYQGAKLHLAPGDYRIVCWGNILENTVIDMEQGVGQAFAFHTSRSASVAVNDDPMFYAPRIADLSDHDASSIVITVPKVGTVERLIDFTAAHKVVEILVKGFSDNGSTLPRIEMTNLASAYDFSMRALSDSPIRLSQITRNETRAENLAVAKFNTAHFNHENDINISIIKPSTGEEVYSLNLQQFLADNNITLTAGDKDHIPIYVEFNDLGVVVSVTKWSGTPVTPGVD